MHKIILVEMPILALTEWKQAQMCNKLLPQAFFWPKLLGSLNIVYGWTNFVFYSIESDLKQLR